MAGASRVLRICTAIAASIVASVSAAPSDQGADHPPLVDAARTRCEVCHAAKREGQVVHAAVDDCQSCHLFSKVDGKSAVTLAAPDPALCVTCHSELSLEAEGTVAAPHAPVTGGCLGCHEAHASANSGLLTTKTPELCFSCHDADSLRSGHGVSVARSDCGACHPPHGSKIEGMLADGVQHAPYAGRNCDGCHRRGLSTRAKGDASKVCFACHSSDAFQAKAVHTVVRRGECLACHDPHSSPNASLVRLAGQELCFSCHGEIAAKLRGATVHAVVDGACDSCHLTHASAHDNLLVEAVPAICATCHDLGDASLAKRHLGAEMAKLDCSSCHDAHGSSLDQLFADGSTHPPFTEKACATCHEDSVAKLVADGDRTLCFACHTEIEAALAGAAHPHAAMEAAECRACHSPHVSRNSNLKRGRGSEICFTCHDDVRAQTGEFQHGAITCLGCESCHEPHGGSRAKLVRATADDLCLGCHDKSRWQTRPGDAAPILLERIALPSAAASRIPTFTLTGGAIGHPLAGHRALGTVTQSERAAARSRANFEGEFHCVTCHDPHKGAVRELLAEGRGEVCSRCHGT